LRLMDTLFHTRLALKISRVSRGSPPELPLRLAVAHLAGARPALVAAPDDRSLLLPVGQPQLVRLEPPDLVAQPAGFLELEVRRRGAHALFEILDVGAQVVADEVVGA